MSWSRLFPCLCLPSFPQGLHLRQSFMLPHLPAINPNCICTHSLPHCFLDSLVVKCFIVYLLVVSLFLYIKITRIFLWNICCLWSVATWDYELFLRRCSRGHSSFPAMPRRPSQYISISKSLHTLYSLHNVINNKIKHINQLNSKSGIYTVKSIM